MSVSSPCNLESGNKFEYPPLGSHHYCLHLLKMLKCPVLVSLFIILALGIVMVLGVQGSPVINTLAARSTAQEGTELEYVHYASLASPPYAKAMKDGAASPPPANATPATTPKELNFIKTSHCSLHKENGGRRAILCGLRKLDLPRGASGVQKWNPSLCRPFHCKCAATKEVHRAKRTIADNRTTLETHRYRIFECV